MRAKRMSALLAIWVCCVVVFLLVPGHAVNDGLVVVSACGKPVVPGVAHREFSKLPGELLALCSVNAVGN